LPAFFFDFIHNALNIPILAPNMLSHFVTNHPMKKALIFSSICMSVLVSCKNDNSKVEELEKKVEQQNAEMQNMKESMLEKELEEKNKEKSNARSEVISNQNNVYHGAWFDIKYPVDFIARGSMPSSSSDNFDSATFTSPDNSVEFYIYSPQWNGEAHDISLKSNEKQSNSKYDDSKSQLIEWWTIEAKDKSYTRSYQKTTNKNSGSISIIGLKYKNQDSYNKYKKQYLEFKASLSQFAD